MDELMSKTNRCRQANMGRALGMPQFQGFWTERKVYPFLTPNAFCGLTSAWTGVKNPYGMKMEKQGDLLRVWEIATLSAESSNLIRDQIRTAPCRIRTASAHYLTTKSPGAIAEQIERLGHANLRRFRQRQGCKRRAVAPQFLHGRRYRLRTIARCSAGPDHKRQP